MKEERFFTGRNGNGRIQAGIIDRKIISNPIEVYKVIIGYRFNFDVKSSLNLNRKPIFAYLKPLNK